MTHLPALPQVRGELSAERIAALEAHVAKTIAQVEDIEELQEWRAQAAALEAYLRGKELNGPMLGAQRRVEARIGQLLGESPGHGPGRGHEKKDYRGNSFNNRQCIEFRVLARGMGQLASAQ